MTSQPTATVQLASRPNTEPAAVTGTVAAEHFVTHRDPAGLEVRPWRVTHIHTGLRIPGEFWAEEYAAQYAEAVAAIEGADWSTADTARATAANATLLPQVVDARRAAEEADRKAWCNTPIPKWPHAEPPTVDDIARVYAVGAQTAHVRRSDAMQAGMGVERGQPGFTKTVRAELDASHAFVDQWAVVHLLRALIKHAPAAANEVAADLWNALESGDALGEWLWQWLVMEYRIDPDTIETSYRQHQEKLRQREAEEEQQASPAST